MEENRIIQIKKGLLLKDVEHDNLFNKLKTQQSIKTFSLRAIIIMCYIGVCSMTVGSQNYELKPFEAVGLLSFIFFIPLAIIIATIGYFKAKKLKPQVKSIADNIMELKNELIDLENSK
jgi:hypothetical protein